MCPPLIGNTSVVCAVAGDMALIVISSCLRALAISGSRVSAVLFPTTGVADVLMVAVLTVVLEELLPQAATASAASASQDTSARRDAWDHRVGQHPPDRHEALLAVRHDRGAKPVPL
jgi:hypothetical protein